MAKITINEVSKNYNYAARNSKFCSVALPITASWGPAFEDPASLGKTVREVLETTAFLHFPATQEGLEAFNATYRGPAANYRSAKDYSFQIATTLLTSGYDVDVCRVCSGTHASATLTATIVDPNAEVAPVTFGVLGNDEGNGEGGDNTDPVQQNDNPPSGGEDPVTDPVTDPSDPVTDPSDPGTDPSDPGTDPSDDPSDPGDDPSDPGDDPTPDPDPEPVTGTLTLRAKYPGSFGNNLVASFTKVRNQLAWNLITYIVDSMGGKTAVENLVWVFDVENSTDTVPHVSEVTSNFFDIIVSGIEQDEGVTFTTNVVTLTGGSDRKADTTAVEMMTDAINLATVRFELAPGTSGTDYVAALTTIKTAGTSVSKASSIRYMEWNYNAAMYVLDILTDKLAYGSKRLILPGWDDQNFLFLTGETVARMGSLSPLHTKMMDVSAVARCMTALLDIPKSVERSGVWIDSTDTTAEGYAQKVSRYLPSSTAVNSDGLFSTHFGLYAPWCQYKYVGMARSVQAPPAFLTLLMQHAMLMNQSLQYEWAQPTTRKHNLPIGDPDYKVPQSLLDQWQSIEGVSLNVLADIPDVGMTIWGNSTSMEVPLSTYNALQNMSTRYLMNAVKDLVFRCGIQITFQYNNQEAYSKFYAGVTPLLDTMKSVGAITAYEISMSKDLDSLGSVNLNSVIGQIAIYVEGVINNLTVDLIALPAGTEGSAAM